MINSLYESKVLTRGILMDLCKSQKYVDADILMQHLKNMDIDPTHYSSILGSTFRIFESEQLIKDTCRVKSSERNSGNLIKIWKSLIYQERSLIS
jgi:hypothetical protein